jgi:hypothetical protein
VGDKNKVGTIVNDWLTDKDSVLSPEFFSNAEAIELPELTFRDVEDLAGDSDEVVSALPPEEETEQQAEQRTAAEREYLKRQRFYDSLDEQLGAVADDGNVFAVTATMSKPTRAFNQTVSTFLLMGNRSHSSISRYNGLQRGSRKAAKPSASDFCVDVELTAKRALRGTPALLAVFQKYILELEGERWEKVPMIVRGKIAEIVGKAFLKAKLCPLGRYFYGTA